MRALILGGNRFFGKRLARLLLEAGDHVTLLNRGHADDGFGGAVHRLRADRKDPKALEAALGSSAWDVVFDQVCFDAVEAADACRLFKERAGRYVFTSTGSVYGFDKREWQTEGDFNPFSYKFDRQVAAAVDYGEAKRQAEAVFFQSSQVPVVAVRFPIVLGDDDYTGRLKFHVDHAREGRAVYFPNPNAEMTFIHSEDAARALFHFRTSPFEGPINAASQDPLRFTDLAKMIEKETGHPLLFAKGEAAGDPSPFGVKKSWMLCSEKLEAEGFLCRPLKDWLPEVIRFYQEPTAARTR